MKSALIADGRVDASNINVDTSASTKTVVLKGSVPTAQQKTTAEAIARDKAEGYTINNQLTVARDEWPESRPRRTPSTLQLHSQTHEGFARVRDRCQRSRGTP